MDARSPASGELVIVGTGIKAISHITNEARANMARADVLFYLVADPLTEEFIQALNPSAISLLKHYSEGTLRLQSYQAMIAEVLDAVLLGGSVCCAFYGHPSVFVYPSHELHRRCLASGVPCEVLPGISADAALYADLSIDPAKDGLSSFEATDFLVFDRPFSPHCGLVLWQIGVIGDLGYRRDRDMAAGLAVLQEKLLEAYPPEHLVTVYEAATLPLMPFSAVATPLSALRLAPVSAISTLYVPPARRATVNQEMMRKLNLSVEALKVGSTAFERARTTLEQA